MYRSKEKKCDMRPTARILLLIILRRSARSRSTDTALAPADPLGRPSISSSCVHIFSTAARGSRMPSRPHNQITWVLGRYTSGIEKTRRTHILYPI